MASNHTHIHVCEYRLYLADDVWGECSICSSNTSNVVLVCENFSEDWCTKTGFQHCTYIAAQLRRCVDCSNRCNELRAETILLPFQPFRPVRKFPHQDLSARGSPQQGHPCDQVIVVTQEFLGIVSQFQPGSYPTLEVMSSQVFSSRSPVGCEKHHRYTDSYECVPLVVWL